MALGVTKTGRKVLRLGSSGPSPALSVAATQAESLIPSPNIGPSLFSWAQLLTNDYDQGGFRLDHYFGNSDQISARYATSSVHELDPLPINGSGVPGFPVTNDITTNSATVHFGAQPGRDDVLAEALGRVE